MSFQNTGILGVIPARYASTRFPAKALALINGKPMVQRVYERCLQAGLLQKLVVATDHPLIYQAVTDFGGNVLFTEPGHPSGTDRCFEAYTRLDEPFDYIINIQGDEPFIYPGQIDALATLLLEKRPQIGTLVKVFTNSELLFSANTAKVLLNSRSEAMAFSRHPVPYFRGAPPEEWLSLHTYYQHIGIYGYSAVALEEITRLPPSKLELAESLEQLRWLENGYKIAVALTEYESHGVDTPEDLERIIQLYKG